MGIVYKHAEHHVTVDHDAGTYRIDTVATLPPATVEVPGPGEVETTDMTLTTTTGDVPLSEPKED